MLSSKTKRELKIDQRQILIDSIEIGIPSTEQILTWGERILPNGKKVGLVKSSKTVNYKRFTPFRDGLFCERIFGPVTSFVCACGKKQPHSKITFCEKCEVEYIDQRSRRYRLGYISLLSPVTHIWYLKGRPSYLSLFLGKRKKTIVALAYCNAYLIEHGIYKKDQNVKTGHMWPSMTSFSNTESFLENIQKKSSVFVPSLRHDQMSRDETRKLKRSKRSFGRTALEGRLLRSMAQCAPLAAEKGKELYLSTSYGSYPYARQHTLPFLPSFISHFYLRDALLNLTYSLAAYDDVPLIEYCRIKRSEPLRDVHKFMAQQTVTQAGNQLHYQENDPSTLIQSLKKSSNKKNSVKKVRPYKTYDKSCFFINQKSSLSRNISKNHTVKRIIFPKTKKNKITLTPKGVSFASAKLKKVSFLPLTPKVFDLALLSVKDARPSLPQSGTAKGGTPLLKTLWAVSKKGNWGRWHTLRVNTQTLARSKEVNFASAEFKGIITNFLTSKKIKFFARKLKTVHAPLGKIPILTLLERSRMKESFMTKKRKISFLELLIQNKKIISKSLKPICRISNSCFFRKGLNNKKGFNHHFISFSQPFKLQDKKQNLLVQESENSKSSLSDLELTAIREILSYTGGGALQQLLQQFDPHDLCKFLFAEIQILRAVYELHFANFSNSWWRSHLSTCTHLSPISPSCVAVPFLAPPCRAPSYRAPSGQEGARHGKKAHAVTKYPVLLLQNKIFGNFQASRSFVSNISNIKIRKVFSKNKTFVQPFFVLHSFSNKDNRSGLLTKSLLSSKKDFVNFSQSFKVKKAKFRTVKDFFSYKSKYNVSWVFTRSVCHLSQCSFLLAIHRVIRGGIARQEPKKFASSKLKRLNFSTSKKIKKQHKEKGHNKVFTSLRFRNPNKKERFTFLEKGKDSTTFNNSQNKFPELRKKQILRISRRIYKIARRLKVAQLLTRNHRRPEWMILSHLPVLPPDLRPILQMSEKVIVASDLNIMYQRVIYRNNRHLRVRFIDFHLVTAIQRLVQDAVDRLIENGKGGSKPYYTQGGRPLKSLSDILKGKKGRFRLNLLGKRVDFSGRSVIVVSPSCKIHECGLPKNIALELYHYFLLRQLIVKKHCASIVTAKKMIKSKSSLMWDILRELMYHHPVLLNRAPTLHRLGIQAFQPKLVLGNAILLHPLVCSGFNADFDGDQMGVHLPLSFAARAESWDLLWSRNNLLSPATGQPMLVPSQDMVLGFYYITAPPFRKTRCSNSIYKKTSFFINTQEITTAFQKGEIQLHEPVWVEAKGKVEDETVSQMPFELRVQSFGKEQLIYKNFIYNNFFIKDQNENREKASFHFAFEESFKSNSHKIPFFICTKSLSNCVRTTAGKILMNNLLTI